MALSRQAKIALLALALPIAACDSNDSDIAPELIREITIVSPVPNDTDGNITTTLTATLYLPEKHQNGQPYPLILHSHSWGGSRVSGDEYRGTKPGNASTPAHYGSLVDSQIVALREGGYAVISYDQRGFGRGDDGDNGSDGGSHGMSPDFEIEDAKAVLDWAVANLNLLEDSPGDPKVGMMGNSYGGAFQPMLAAEDPRVDAIVPSITWYNLQNAFAPNGVLKKAWLIAICDKVVDEDGAQLSAEMELACTQVRLTDSREINDARITESLFFDNSPAAYDADPAFVMPRVDALILQGVRDTLFPLNEGLALHEFLLSGGGDVRLLAHESGHDGVRRGAGSQGEIGQPYCGNIDVITAIKRWFDEKLLGAVPLALPRICVALDNQRAIHLGSMPATDDTHRVTITPLASVFGSSENNVQSAANEALFYTLPQITDSNLALLGTPIARLVVEAAPTNSDPTPLTGPNAAGLFVGIGILRDNRLFLVDDQVQPILSTDARTDETPEPIPLTAVAEKLEVGDRVGVLVYGKHDLYENHPIDDTDGIGSNWQGNAATFFGVVDLPIVEANTIDERP